MKPLEPPDTHHLKAAEGWLGLGVKDEAHAELEKINPALRSHPDVVEVRWQILASEEKWQACLDVANGMLEAEPDNSLGWIWRAYSLRRTAGGGGLLAAQECLVHAHAKFPAEFVIPYNLACYACQLGELRRAREWLKKACDTSSTTIIKGMALHDPDLKPLWTEIDEM